MPLTPEEDAKLQPRVTVNGFDNAAVQAACNQAKQQNAVVFLPAGTYQFSGVVTVPAGLKLLGAGSGTVIQATSESVAGLFALGGDKIRITRMKILGANMHWNRTNNTTGIMASGRQDTRIDHDELAGFKYAINVGGAAAIQIDHCSIHHNLVDGLGYGVLPDQGTYALIIDSEFSQCRHMLASNGAGRRPTNWQFRHNHVQHNDEAQVQEGALDIHPGMVDGTSVTADNVFEDLTYGLEIDDGSGWIAHNVFRRFSGWAIAIRQRTQHGTLPQGSMPHDYYVDQNTFEAVKQPLNLGTAKNITQDGQMLSSTQDANYPRVTKILWLNEMGDDQHLTWTEVPLPPP